MKFINALVVKLVDTKDLKSMFKDFVTVSTTSAKLK